MNAVALADVITAIGFGVALIFILLLPVSPTRRYVRPMKLFMAGGMALYLFVGVANTLKWAGVTDVLEVFGDRAEVLFIPLLAYLAFSLSTAQQLETSDASRRDTRREQDLLGRIVDTTPAGILVMSPGKGITLANDVARDILGLRASPEGGPYQTRDDIRLGPEPGSVTSVAEGLRAVLAEEPVVDVVSYVEHPGGRTVALEINAKELGEGGGDATVVVAFVDITDRLRYRQDLERAVDARTRELIEVNRQLEIANGAKRDFLARMSHELRTPLNSIIGFTGTLLQGQAGELTGEQRRQLEMVRSSGSSLLSLVNDVLDIAKIETGRAALRLVRADACLAVRHATDLLAPVAAARGVDLDVDCEAGTTVVIDEDKLGQIVRNLVGNAVKFTDQGGWVRVVVHPAGGEVRISVSDSGAGMSESDVRRISEAFAHRESEGRESGGGRTGIGIGLSVCRDLAELLGGRMEVESVLGTGSTFTVVLPPAPPAPASAVGDASAAAADDATS